ncbi:uncharacterized protein LOC122057353 isoform X1 [Macadamia integrifolia]|uniref:uncharacterized protein LOC122057353 isoform X1 n=1 Tax=Macadamia integrifolia TaxID=60698 RepID=UPI001C530F63|nr:uncharacterized protein LOC122057353 isoform X1 [Macadamia integrifolia]
MNQLEWTMSSLPEDIALKIASLLQVSDLCSLGSCSRFWREFCASDSIWIFLFRERWPSMVFSTAPVLNFNDRSSAGAGEQFSSTKGWRAFYINRHIEMANRDAIIAKFVKQCSPSESLEVGDYLKVIEDLCSIGMGFRDVQMFLFASKHNVLLNLIGLHYSICSLGVPADYVVEALWNCQISERQVCVRWWKLGRWIHGFRLRDESHTRMISLGDLAMAKEGEVFGVLHRGAIHEVLRVQISVPAHTHTRWTF